MGSPIKLWGVEGRMKPNDGGRYLHFGAQHWDAYLDELDAACWHWSLHVRGIRIEGPVARFYVSAKLRAAALSGDNPEATNALLLRAANVLDARDQTIGRLRGKLQRLGEDIDDLLGVEAANV